MAENSFIPEIRDFHLLLAMPIVAYWLSASIFHLFDCQRWFQAYKIHSPEAGQKRNRATLRQVFCQVLAQQFIQVVFALAVDKVLAQNDTATRPAPSNINSQNRSSETRLETLQSGSDSRILPEPAPVAPAYPLVEFAVRLASAILIADFWQYFWHRMFHSSKLLYSKTFTTVPSGEALTPELEHVHSVHHRIYVPYAYGALYSSLVEAFIVDTIGTTVTFYLSGLPVVPATWFASLSIIKSVNDHSGYRFPYNPFDYISANTTDFHDVHHQSWGMKSNYSQIYLTIWASISPYHSLMRS